MQNNPQAVVDAIYPDPILIGNIELRPLTMGTLIFLQKINHPILKVLDKPDQANQIEITLGDVMNLVFAMSHLPSECNRLRCQGTFDAAVLDFADTIEPAEIRTMGEKIQAHFRKQFETSIPYGQKKTAAGTESGEMTSRTSGAPDSAGR